MPRGIPADRAHKAEIVAKIRDGGQSVSSVSNEYGISSKTIYVWRRYRLVVMLRFGLESSLTLLTYPARVVIEKTDVYDFL